MNLSTFLIIGLLFSRFVFADECYDRPLEEDWLEQEKIFIGKVLSATLVEETESVPIVKYEIKVLKVLKGDVGKFIVVGENPIPYSRLPVGSISIVFIKFRNVIDWCSRSGPFDLELRAPQEFEDSPIFKEDIELKYAEEVRQLMNKYPLTRP